MPDRFRHPPSFPNSAFVPGSGVERLLLFAIDDIPEIGY
jgi:hypothetical protein